MNKHFDGKNWVNLGESRIRSDEQVKSIKISSELMPVERFDTVKADTWKCFLCKQEHPINHEGIVCPETGVQFCCGCNPRTKIRVLKLRISDCSPWMGFRMNENLSGLFEEIRNLAKESEHGDELTIQIEDLPAYQVARWKDFQGW
jgi:hypothetical protein